MFLKRLLYYIDPRTLFHKSEGKSNINLKMMHGMNRISVIIFLMALMVMLVRFLSRL